MKKTNVNEMYGANLAKLNEDETREMIEEFRNDGYDENYIQQFLADVAAAKNSVDNNGVPLAEKFGGIDPLNPNGEDYDPLKIDRRGWTDGVYRALTLKAQMITEEKNGTERQALRLTIRLFDDALNRKQDIVTTFYEGYFNGLFELWASYYSDKNPRTLEDCLKLSNQIEWYCKKKTNGAYTNYTPVRYTVTSIENVKYTIKNLF